MDLRFIFLLVALICFVAGALGARANISWTNAGLASLVLSMLV